MLKNVRRSAIVLAGTVLATGVAAQPVVLTDLPVTRALVEMVGGDRIDLPAALNDGTDPHHAALRPSQARDLAGGDLLVWMGADVTPWLDRAAGDVAPGLPRHGLRGPQDDLHAWLDPAVARNWLPGIADALAALDPDGAAAFAANADAAAARIDAAVAEARTILAGAIGRRVVTAHDAYGPFAAAFGVTIVGSYAASDGADPGARSVQDLRRAIDAQEVACLFEDAGHGSRGLRAIAADTGLPLGALDATGGTLVGGPDLYPRLIAGLARTIAECVR